MTDFIANLKSKLEKFDTKKANRGWVLMQLQSMNHDFYAFDDWYSRTEKRALELLTKVRIAQEATDERERFGKTQ